MEHIEKYHETLMLSLADITNQLNLIAHYDNDSGDWIIRTNDIDQTEADPNTQADAAEVADERVSILAELENRYRLIQHALRKVELGTYGQCEICAVAIEEKRLDANPAARTCILHMDQEYQLPLS